MAPTGPGHDGGARPGIRVPWAHSDRPVPRMILRPLQAYLQTSSASAVVLFGAVILAVAWANSPWRDIYDRLWTTPISVRIGARAITEDLRHLVTDGLMSLFFLLVGLEIKREFAIGELRRWRVASVPVVAAIGGMVVPALIYIGVNRGTPGIRGWGVPMATDIAFALAVLTLAAAHAPVDLRPFLLSLAIVDDIGAIIVIALFYSGGIAWPALVVVVLVGLTIMGLQRIHVRATPVYLVLGFWLWFAMFESGVHATIAGVILGLLTPARPFQRSRHVSVEARRTADETVDDPSPPDVDAESWMRLSWLSKETVSPLARVEHTLLPWTSFVVLPLFALASAGIELSVSSLRDALGSRITLGIVLGLVVGKLVGVWGAASLATRLRFGTLPAGVRGRDLAGVGQVAGIGFTVALFVAELAFGDGSSGLNEAKIGVLTASVLAGALSSLFFRVPR
ncbi:MAG: Na+/H+ antiporter NhaA [Actinomycetota bacterium]